MGRHRRSAAGHAATGGTGNSRSAQLNKYGKPSDADRSRAPGDKSDAVTAPHAYVPSRAAVPAEGFESDSYPRRRYGALPLYAGLVGASVAVAMGALALASGPPPNRDNADIAIGGLDNVLAADIPDAAGSSDGEQERTGRQAPSAKDSGDGVKPASFASRPSPDRRIQRPAASEAKTAAAVSVRPTTQVSKKSQPADTPKSGGAVKRTNPVCATDSPAKPKAPKAPESDGRDAPENFLEFELLRLINQERAQAGVSPVNTDDALGALAEAFSKDMADRHFFDHTDPDGSTAWERAEREGITTLGGHIISRGHPDTRAAIAAWMKSPEHRAGILNSDFKFLGIGVYFGPDGPLLTLNFGY